VGVEPYPNLRRIQNVQGFEGKFGEKVIHPSSEWRVRATETRCWIGAERKSEFSPSSLCTSSLDIHDANSPAPHSNSHLNRARSGVPTSSSQNLQSLSSQPIRGHWCSVNLSRPIIRQRLESSRRVSSFSRKCSVLSPSQVMFRSSSFYIGSTLPCRRYIFGNASSTFCSSQARGTILTLLPDDR
jgi:hypothetical protein